MSSLPGSDLPSFAGFPSQINQELIKHLTPVFGDSEARAISWQLLEAILDSSKTQLLISQHPIDDLQSKLLSEALSRLKSGEPLQYILQRAYFCGLELVVGPGALIPRPETEELVYWILEEENQEKKRVLDLCTGSGCLALALKNVGKWGKVAGLDVSESALILARKSAQKLGLSVHWIQGDLLQESLHLEGNWDVIVANPPYVLETEAAEMEPQVLRFEPHLALFVEDSDPILFYKKIGLLASHILKPGGSLYFELNPKTDHQVADCLRTIGFKKIEFRADMQGKNRMLRCEKSTN